MTTFSGEFNLSGLERVISGPGSAKRVGAELDRRGLSRAVLVTGRTLGASKLLSTVTDALRDRCVAVFAGARQHVPSTTVADLTRLIESERADCVISFGGGSPIDTAKAAIYRLVMGGGESRASGGGPLHIAIPTTLSAGEFTSVAGITDESTRIKRPVADPRITAKTVITDPVVTLETPTWLWAGSGVRALDHAVESIYSVRHHPVSDAAASRGLAMILRHLPASVDPAASDVLEHRVQCQLAAWSCVFGVTNAGFGLSHALGHQIGPRWNVPHGITSCITLPHAMRFMADLAPERFRPIADGFGLPFDAANPKASAMACAARAAAFIAQFDLPRRLRDAQVPADEVPAVARIVHEVMEAAHVVDRPVTREELTSLLTGAY